MPQNVDKALQALADYQSRVQKIIPGYSLSQGPWSPMTGVSPGRQRSILARQLSSLPAYQNLQRNRANRGVNYYTPTDVLTGDQPHPGVLPANDIRSMIR